MATAAELSDVIDRSDDLCSREAIHLAGAIQPHGFLIGLAADTLKLVTKSANIDACLGKTALGRIPVWMPARLLERCRHLSSGSASETFLLERIEPVGWVEAHCFRSGQQVFCEFEPVGDGLPPLAGEQAALETELTLRRLEAITDIGELSQTAAAAIRAISGYERVLVYRFDPEGHGDVLGESLCPDWEQSFLGLRFPASDIPAQARALYRLTCDRWIPSRDYQEIALVPPVAPDGIAFDIGLSRYRSVSPIHRLYQRNIGVDGSMSVSVMQDGNLWGLVIGHHRTAHHVPASIRHKVVGIVQAFSMRLNALLSKEIKAEQERDLHAYSAVLRKLAGADDFLTALTEGSPNIAELLPHCSGAAVVWECDAGSDQARLLGETPPAQDVVALVKWIRETQTSQIFQTASISQLFPAFATHQRIASGVLAGNLNDPRHPVLLFFRPEVVHSVNWAGKPEKLVSEDGRLHLPRRSFERWVEVKRGFSRPWLPWEQEVVETVCVTVSQVIVRQMRKIAELDSEIARFAQALTLSSTTLYHQDRELRYQWVFNPSIGFTAKTVGALETEVLDAELASRVIPIKREVLETGTGKRMVIPTRLNDPNAEWFDLSIEPLVNGEGKIYGLSCAGMRITDRMRAETALRRNEALLREVQQIARLGHYVYDFRSDHWESSPVLDNILGIGPDFPRNAESGLQLVAPEMQAQTQALLHSLQQGEASSFDTNFRLRRQDDGRLRWVAAVGHLEKAADGTPLCLIGTILDIEERIQTEQRLRDALKRLEVQAEELARSNSELEKFAYVASHDLRQPLRAISGYIGMLNRRLGSSLDEECRNFIETAISGSKKMDRMIIDLLEYSRVGRRNRAAEAVDLAKLLEDCLLTMENARQDADGDIRIVSSLPMVCGHPQELARLFQNLIGNALKYRPADRLPRIEIGCKDAGEAWELWVSDNGIGIAQQDYDRAFEVFQRLTTQQTYEGTGIGLSVCKKIIETHGGRIWIESTLDVGTTFHMTLPK